MAFDFLLLFLGFGLLLGGGELLVRGASALAKSLGVSPLFIGLTIVAFGTSTPELAVNLMATFQGNPGISFGNIIGSNIANIGLILGLAALVRPLTVSGTIISREIPMMALTAVLALILGGDSLLRGVENQFDRSDGLVFLLLFGIFLYYTIGEVLNNKSSDPLLAQAGQHSPVRSFRSLFLSAAFSGGGLLSLILGGKVAVEAAVSVAQALNIPNVIIGLTIVAVGTSLPELVTSALAAWKGETDLAIGNVVGSNIFNLLFINGLCATIRPISVPPAGGMWDLGMMVFLSLLLLPVCLTHKRRIVRWEGVLLISLYFGFNTWRIFAG
ncbi:MAG: calcium/sodium antiporter [Deltaproteobacteria bacterium]|nr:calcium/sodium antiporter [Deltaproteobacteria bacterium]